MSIRAVVVDDQPDMRTAIRTILTAGGIEVVGEAGTGAEAVQQVRRLHPDVVLMDIRMPGGDGVAATAQLHSEAAAARVLVLTTFDHDDYIDGALRAGAAGFLLKNTAPEQLIAAVRTIASGEGVLDPAIVGRVMSRFAPDRSPAAPVRGTSEPIDSLTDREREVLDLLCRGCSNTEIAARLGVGEATAKTHVARVLDKLFVRDRVQAVIHAYECGFAPWPRP